MKINIAIDGPSAAGKSTISKYLAKKMNYVHLDTGAMYRLVAYKCLLNNCNLDDQDEVLNIVQDIHIDMRPNGQIFLDGNEIKDEIRTEEISMAASKVSQYPGVRQTLVNLQQQMAKEKGFVMDGRDIASIVLPDAEIKIFLTATAESRGLRRHLQNLEKGFDSDLEQIIKDIEARDENDRNRTHSPLIKVQDAIELDTSNLTLNEVEKTLDNIVENYFRKDD